MATAPKKDREVKITWDAYQKLNETERAMLTLLGFTAPTKPTERRKTIIQPQIPPPKEYNLRVHCKCLLCGFEFQKDFFMRRAFQRNNWFLKAIPVLDELVQNFTPDKHTAKVVQSCHNCQNFLVQKSKEELAAMVVDLHWRVDLPRQKKKNEEKEITCDDGKP
jgi:hypothetical protein